MHPSCARPVPYASIQREFSAPDLWNRLCFVISILILNKYTYIPPGSSVVLFHTPSTVPITT